MKLILNTGKKMIPLVVLVIFFSVLLMVFFNTDFITNKARNALMDAVKEQFGDDVRIGRLTLFPLNRITLQQVTLMNGDKPLLQAERISVSLYLSDLVRGTEGIASSIKTIRVVNPELYLTKTNDGFGFEKYFKQKREVDEELNFFPTIELSGGKVHYQDEKIKESLTNLDGALKIQPDGISLEVKGKVNSLKELSLNLKGTITPKLAFDLIFADLPFAAVKQYGLNLQGIEEIGGKGSGSVHVEQNSDGEWSYSGNLTLQNGMVKSNMVPTAIDQINGTIRVEDQTLYLDTLTGRTAAGRFKLTGEVSKFSDPILMVTLSTTGLDLQTIGEFIPNLPESTVLPSGMLSGTIDVSGNWRDPLVKVALQVPELKYGELVSKPMTANLRYQDSFITIQNITLPVNEGKLQVYSGYVSVREKDNFVYSLNVDVENIHLQKVLKQLPTKIAEVPEGVLNGKLYLSGEGLKQDKVTAIGYVNLEKLKYQEIPVDQIKANFWFTDGEIGVSKLEIKAPYLQTTVTGRIDVDGEVDLSVEPSSIDLSWFGKQFGFAAEGKGTLAGDIQGSIKDPYFLGEIFFDKGQVWGQAFDKVVGQVRVDKEELTLSSTSLVRGSTDLRLTGKVGFMREDLDLRADIVYSSLQDLKKMLNFMEIPFDISGDITGNVILAGPWKDIQVDGDVTVIKGAVAGQPFDAAQMTFAWKDNDILFKNFHVSYQNTLLHASGMIDDYKTLEIDMEGKDFDITDIQQLRDTVPDLTGRANFRGKLTGKLTSPAFWGTISTDSLHYNKVPIEQLSALLQYSNNVLKIKPMKVINGVSDYTLIGEVNFTDKKLEMQIKPRRTKITDFLRYVNSPLKTLDYDLEGDVWIRGSFDRPRVEVEGVLTDGKNGSLEVSGIYEFKHGMNLYLNGQQFDLSPFKPLVKFDQFDYILNGEAIVQGTVEDPHVNMEINLTNGKSSMAVSGAYDLKKGMDLRINGSQFDLEPFKIYLPNVPKYTGKINVAGTVSGTIDDLDAELNIDIIGGSFNDYVVQKLGGLVQIKNSKTIYMDQELALPDGSELRVKGSAPITDKNGPLDLELMMKKGNLEMLALLIPGVEKAGGGGKGQFQITGTMTNPVINGELNISQGFLKYQGIDAIADMKAKILMVNNTVNIKEMGAKYGKGTVGLTGTISLNGFMPANLDLKVKTKNFHFVYGSINAMGDTDGLAIKGPFESFEVRGPIRVHDAEVGVIPFVWPMPEKKGESKFAPTFYLELYPGENVHVTGASPINMDATIMRSDTEPLVIDTTSGEVILSGDLSSRNGTFNIYNANFRVSRASASFIKYNKFIPILSIKAQTNIDKYRVYLDLDGLPSEINQLKMSLYSDPPLTERQIMSLMANQGGLGELIEGGEVTDMISNEIWRFVNQGLRSNFLNKLESSVERALHLDTFQVDPILFGDTKVNVQVGKFVSDKLYVVYNRTFSQSPKQSIGFEYQIRQNISLEGTYEGFGDYQVGLKARFPF